MDDTTDKITSDDVGRLAKDPSPENRVSIASRLGRRYNSSMDPRERELAEGIFRALICDAEVRVRAALSKSLESNPDVPRGVALSLAWDVAEVATGILRHSEVVPEEELLRITAEASVDHRIAVAGRREVSETLADALVERGEEDVVATLVSNEGARLSERALSDVIEKFGDNERINDPLVRRKQLPIAIAERLVSLVSDQLRAHLLTHHALSRGTASDLVRESRERATMSLIDEETSELDVTNLVQQLHENDRLTPNIILQAIGLGDYVFFEAAMARLCGISLVNAFKLIDDPGEKGLEAICKRAGIPSDFLPIIRTALRVAQETDPDERGRGRRRFVASMAERVLTTCEESIDGPARDYLMRHLKLDAVPISSPVRPVEKSKIDA